MKFVCRNSECINFGEIDEVFKTTQKIKDGQIVCVQQTCPKCGMLREDATEYEPLSQKNIQFLKVESMSIEDKKKVLKDRSHSHYEKHIKERKYQMWKDSFKTTPK